MNTDQEWDLDTPVVGGALVCPQCGDLFSPFCERCPDDNALLEPQLLHPDRDALIGTVLDRKFRILRPLAEGSMGRVYEGIQLPDKRPVAIKIIREELVRDPLAAQRFLREVRMLMRITHPNIVEVCDYGEQDGSLFFVMELLRGNSLDAILAAEGPFSMRRTCELGIQICSALVAAHGKGVVHRDLKPANIVMLAGGGDWIKVLDFGLAKRLGADSDEITFTGIVPGTPLYMSPEAVRCESVGPRGDLYSVGCILFELLTGAAPFAGDSAAMVLVRQLDDAPPALPETVPVELRQLIASLLSKMIGDRPISAADVRSQLESILRAL